ncbi:uncharacterized protein LOC128503955 [Spea bombifrons]|uniref:uncharacterized protein LOC128503955 n=1 Tax=Spea bombifrons TaxID=233779 RepID=UPI00234B375F|nr:uncharacterized protein LOC128503955 [Spea bombifrons]
MASVIQMAAVSLLSVLLGAATGHPHRKHCHLSKYRSISLGEMAELRELQNHEEEMEVGVKCHHGLRLKRFPQCDLKGEERLTLTLHRVSLAVEVLQNLSGSDRGHRSLDIFSSLKKELSSCKMRNSSVLESCRGHLMKYSETVSAECLRRDVLLNLVWLLVEDVRLLIPGEYNVRETQKEAPQPPPTETAPQKHPNGRRNHRRNGKFNTASF